MHRRALSQAKGGLAGQLWSMRTWMVRGASGAEGEGRGLRAQRRGPATFPWGKESSQRWKPPNHYSVCLETQLSDRSPAAEKTAGGEGLQPDYTEGTLLLGTVSPCSTRRTRLPHRYRYGVGMK